MARILLGYIRDDQIDINGRYEATPLHYAVASGNEILVKILLQRGAQISRSDHSGLRVLHYPAGASSVFIDPKRGYLQLQQPRAGRPIGKIS